MTWLKLPSPSQTAASWVTHLCLFAFLLLFKNRLQTPQMSAIDAYILHANPIQERSHHGVLLTFQNWIQFQATWHCTWVFVGQFVITIIASCHVWWIEAPWLAMTPRITSFAIPEQGLQKETTIVDSCPGAEKKVQYIATLNHCTTVLNKEYEDEWRFWYLG